MKKVKTEPLGSQNLNNPNSFNETTDKNFNSNLPDH